MGWLYLIDLFSVCVLPRCLATWEAAGRKIHPSSHASNKFFAFVLFFLRSVPFITD